MRHRKLERMQTGTKNGMNMRLGRIGAQEGVSVLSIALTLGGVFTLETKTLYEHGNSAYLTVPAAVLISLVVFILLLKSMQKAHVRDLYRLLEKGYGNAWAAMLSIPIMLLLLFSAFLALSQFVNAMHGLFFEGVSYSRIAVFVIPAVLIIAWLGLETIGRTAKCFAILLAILLVVTIAASSAEFDAYRLYPFPGNTIGKIAIQTIEEIGAFLPAMAGVLICAEGLNDSETVKKAGIFGAAAASILCFIALLAIGMTYTYTELSDQFLPLFRINYLNMFEAHLMRMDKLAHIVWLNGAIISSAFYIYSASLLFAKAFSIRDIRPVLASSAMIVFLLILLETETLNNELFKSFKMQTERSAFLILPVPIILAAILAIKKTRGNETV